MNVKPLLTILGAALILAFVLVEAAGIYHDQYHLTVLGILIAYQALYLLSRNGTYFTRTERRLYRRISLICWALAATSLFGLIAGW